MQSDGVLVTGATGFIGRVLARELSHRGIAVSCATRSKSVITDSCQRQIAVGEVGATTDWHSALEGVDTVIHLVARAHILKETSVNPTADFEAVNHHGTRRLAECAVTAGVKRLVYVSSIGVNGDRTQGSDVFSELSAINPHNAYAQSKLEAEKALAEVAMSTGLEVVTLRPPLVYGPNNPGNFMRLLRLIDRGVPLPLASIKNRRSFIFVENLVDLLITAAFRPAAAGQLYLVSDNEHISTPQLIKQLARLMARPARLWPFPSRGLKLASKIIGREGEIDRLVGSLIIDNRKTLNQLKWRPPFTLLQGLEKTVSWYRSSS